MISWRSQKKKNKREGRFINTSFKYKEDAIPHCSYMNEVRAVVMEMDVKVMEVVTMVGVDVVVITVAIWW